MRFTRMDRFVFKHPFQQYFSHIRIMEEHEGLLCIKALFKGLPGY